ncbi:ArnT family glycosyltransferase [Hymenobacter metallilatus]|uniref:Phospholipid carrier-dependent glycosyltransferase n=1 Tax=Hymenobacter metallilatus TaxID=2493666 RepID=A0A428JU72_9BACT|nr:glycosyltransferase family 39 protein [Hymenobacter metallilatus]RSK37512.1 phospholipid carrier-dependent glycosyltransferase [Hymenobacter metallilatus]
MPAAAIAPAIRRAPRWVVWAFFGGLLVLGRVLVTDYGVSWDEPVDHRNGLVSLRYVAGLVAPEWAARQPLLREVPLLQGYPDNDHGVLFELPLALYDVLRSGTEPREYYMARHFCTFLVCLGGVWALYRLARRRFRNEYAALLTAGLLVLSPRLFAESFYNAKDLVFLAAFTLSMLTLARLLARPTAARALLHGLATGLAIDIRILGSMLVPLTLGLLLLEGWAPTAPGSRWGGVLRAGLLYLAGTVAVGIAGWPYLWEAPIHHFLAAFRSMGHFRWDEPVLYWGATVSARNLPWHYIPVWLLLTTPVAYSGAALAGLLAVGARLLRQPLHLLRTYEGRLDILFGVWLLGPIVLVIGLHSVVYDGWRHLYFVYPALLLLAVGAGLELGQRRHASQRWRAMFWVVAVVAGLEALLTAGRMVRMHPNQQVYFSFLPAGQVAQLFERDYWGLAYRQGLEYLVRRQPTGIINVDVSHVPPFENNRALLPAPDRARLRFNPEAPNRYFLMGYRRFAGQLWPEMGEEVYVVKADGLPILSVCRVRPR